MNNNLAALTRREDYLQRMELDYWKQNWDLLGKDDPLWVVLTDESKRGGKWRVEEFFETGRAEIEQVFQRLNSLGIAPAPNKALDFGCGVGRLSQALSLHFSEVHGVDISSSMIARAREFATGVSGCHFHINSSDRLEMFQDQTFDFVYSNIALQHIEPVYAKRYLREFFRVLRPGGLAVFQLLAATIWRKLFPQFLVDRYRTLKHGGAPYFGMFGVPERQVTQLIREASGKILDLRRTKSTDLSWRWVSLNYVAVKGHPA